MKQLFKGSSLLNILGMTAAFAALYIILVQVHYDLTYNRSIPDSERVYLMTLPLFGQDKNNAYINRPMAEEIIADIPCVEAYGIAQLNEHTQTETPVTIGEGTETKSFVVRSMQVTSGALDVFGIQSVSGSLDGIGTNAFVAISQSATKRMGVTVDDRIDVTINGKVYPYTICAIFEDQPMTSDLGGMEMIVCNLLEKQDLNNTSNWSYNYFVKLHSTDDKAIFEEVAGNMYVDIQSQQIAHYRGMGNISESLTNKLTEMEEFMKEKRMTAIPLRDLYFCNDLNYQVGQKGNKTTTITLIVVAALIVIITLINFINFFFAQVPMRIRSVNTRKILGSSRAALVGRFLMESALLVAIALVLAVAVVKAFASSEWAHFVSCDLALSKNIVVALLTVGIALVATLLAGTYPAMYATSFSPAFAIKGSFGMTQKGKSLRYALIGLQFVISIAFIICAMFFKQQHKYMMSYDMGYNKECLLSTSVPVFNMENREAFTNELLSNPNIKGVAWAQGPITMNDGMTWGRWHNDQQMMIRVLPVSWNFLQFMGIEVYEGRDFLPSDELGEGAIILNEYAKKKYNLNLKDKIAWGVNPHEATGFCRDIHYKPLQYEGEAFAFYIYGEEFFVTSHCYIRTIENADIKAVFDAIRSTTDKILPDYGGEKVKINFFDEELGENYQKEQQLTTTISLFTLLAIIISLMGVFGLVIFETQYRRKEIGIRRVNGATVEEILLMFNRKFVAIVLICFAVAAPISYFVTDYYYSTFAYRAPIVWWVFALALLAVLFVTVLTVSIGSFRTATENPVKALRTE